MSSDEDKAKTAGTVGAITTAGGIGALAAGASAAEMTAALATVGGVVGGGMAAGIGLVAAAPLAIGYGLYKWFSD